MIKFFRKIRQKVLSENKFSKYLFYAIGEIILVVIGILLALKVNTINEQRKDNNSEKVYLRSLQTDLNLQSKILNERIVFETEIIKATEKAIDYIDNDLFNQETDSLRLDLLQGMATRTFSISDATYQDLKSTGNLKLISDHKLKQRIIRAYNLLYEEDKIYFKNNPIVESFYANYLRDNKIGFFYDNKGKLQSSKLNSPEHLYELRFKVISRKFFAMGHLDRMVKIQESIIKLSEEIEEWDEIN